MPLSLFQAFYRSFSSSICLTELSAFSRRALSLAAYLSRSLILSFLICTSPLSLFWRTFFSFSKRLWYYWILSLWDRVSSYTWRSWSSRNSFILRPWSMISFLRLSSPASLCAIWLSLLVISVRSPLQSTRSSLKVLSMLFEWATSEPPALLSSLYCNISILLLSWIEVCSFSFCALYSWSFAWASFCSSSSFWAVLSLFYASSCKFLFWIISMSFFVNLS